MLLPMQEQALLSRLPRLSSSVCRSILGCPLTREDDHLGGGALEAGPQGEGGSFDASPQVGRDYHRLSSSSSRTYRVFVVVCWWLPPHAPPVTRRLSFAPDFCAPPQQLQQLEQLYAHIHTCIHHCAPNLARKTLVTGGSSYRHGGYWGIATLLYSSMPLLLPQRPPSCAGQARKAR